MDDRHAEGDGRRVAISPRQHDVILGLVVGPNGTSESTPDDVLRG